MDHPLIIPLELAGRHALPAPDDHLVSVWLTATISAKAADDAVILAADRLGRLQGEFVARLNLHYLLTRPASLSLREVYGTLQATLVQECLYPAPARNETMEETHGQPA